jgi:ABC-type branched-subunit amino acid transport system permease subunit
MTAKDKTPFILLAGLVVLLVIGPFLPGSLFALTMSMGRGLVVLGLMILLRTGLVSFGQGLYYCVGAYAVGSLSQFASVRNAVVLLLAGTLAATVLATLLGFLLANYRSIFFAMLTLAFSMIVYGLLVKTSTLGSTDGFNVPPAMLFGKVISGQGAHYPLFALVCVVAFVAALLTNSYLWTALGQLSSAIRDNEIRVEYMGASVRNAIHTKYVIAGALAGLGGSLTALTIGHIDPEMAYWTTSGEFVFVAILGGTGSVVAPFLGAIIFEFIRTYAYQYSPNTWQLVLGTAMMLVIIFLPAGLWSAFARLRRRG